MQINKWVYFWNKWWLFGNKWFFLIERFYQFWASFFDNGKEKAPVSCSLIGAFVIPLAM